MSVRNGHHPLLRRVNVNKKKTAKAGMKKQLIAQLRAKGKMKVTSEKPGPEIVDDFTTPEAELNKQTSRLKIEDKSETSDEMLQEFHAKVAEVGEQAGVKPKPLAGLPAHPGVKVPTPPKKPYNRHGDILPCCDYQGRTCLQLDRGVSTVTYMDLTSAASWGLHLQYMPKPNFDMRFKPLDGSGGNAAFPIDKAVKTFVKFAKEYGATQDVLDWLGRVVKLTKEELDMAAKKSKASGSTSAKKPAAGAKVAGPKKPGSGMRIRELLMKRVGTDEILKIIHKEFPGSKAKSSDVAWNKGKLKADGVKVPEPK
jgi:hypothetical protein